MMNPVDVRQQSVGGAGAPLDIDAASGVAAPDAQQADPAAPGLSAAEAAARLQMRQMSGGFSSAALMARLQAGPGQSHPATQAGDASQAQQTGAPGATGVDIPARSRPESEASLDDVRMGAGKYIRKGESGERVKALQEALNAAGIQPPLEADGVCGPAMEAAIRKFQEEHGCAVDGIVGPETMGALDLARGITPNAAYTDAKAGHGGGASGAGGASGPSGVTPSGPSGGGAMSGIDRVIDYTARFESSRRYDAWNPDDAGHGVSFGLIQFNQEVGGLPTLFRKMHDADPAKFNQVMGPHASHALSSSWVKTANLNDPDIKSRMLQLARDPGMQQVQRDEARRGYFDPAMRLAEQYGLKSERAMSMLFDSCVQNGSGGTAKFLREAAAGGGGERAILERFADAADRGRTGRRHKLLSDGTLSDGPFNPGAPSGPAASGGAVAPSNGGAVAPSGGGSTVGPSGGATGADGGRLLDRPIGPGTKVLMIGDSHTCGVFGGEMDKLLRSTGASVESYGSSGSSPSWWMNGQTTHSGFVARHADGRVEQPPWNSPHATPKLADLIREQKPDVLVVSLGGNMRGMSESQVKAQVKMLADVAKANGTKLVWAGPPDRRADMENPAELERFNRMLRDAVAPYGGFVEGSKYTSEYAGGDGVHYGGEKGNRIAREWAGGVFGEIQRRSAPTTAG